MDSSDNLTNISNRTLLKNVYKELPDSKTPRPRILNTLSIRNKYLSKSDISTSSQLSNESRKRSWKESLERRGPLNDTSFISISACDDDEDTADSYNELMKSTQEYVGPAVRRKKRKEEVSKSFHVNLPRKRQKKSSRIASFSSDDDILDPTEILAEADALLSNMESEKFNKSVFLNTTKSYANIKFKRHSHSPVNKSQLINAVLERSKGNKLSDSPGKRLHANNSFEQQSSSSADESQNLNITVKQGKSPEITIADSAVLPNSNSKKSQRKGKLLSALKKNANKSVNDITPENIVEELASSQTKNSNKKAKMLNTTKIHEDNSSGSTVQGKRSATPSKELQKKGKLLNSSKSVDCEILNNTVNEFSSSQPRKLNKKKTLQNTTETPEHNILGYEVQDGFDHINTSLSNSNSKKPQKNKVSFNVSKTQHSNRTADGGRERNLLDINSETPCKIIERPVLQRKLENYFTENSNDDEEVINSNEVSNVSEISRIQTRSLKKKAMNKNKQIRTSSPVLSSKDTDDVSERRTLEFSPIRPTKGKSRNFSIGDVMQLSAIQPFGTPRKTSDIHNTSLLLLSQRKDVGSPEIMSKSFPSTYRTRSSQRKAKSLIKSNLEEPKTFVETNNAKKSARKSKTLRIPTSSSRPRQISDVQEVDDLGEMNDLVETEDSQVQESTKKNKSSSKTPTSSISRSSLRLRTTSVKGNLKKIGALFETNRSHDKKSKNRKKTYSEIPSTSVTSDQKIIVSVKNDLVEAVEILEIDKSHKKRAPEIPSTSFSRSARGKSISAIVQEVDDLDEMSDLVETEDSHIQKSTMKNKSSSRSSRRLTIPANNDLKKAKTFLETNRNHDKKSINRERTYSGTPSTSFSRSLHKKSIVFVRDDSMEAVEVPGAHKSHRKRASGIPSTSFSRSARGKSISAKKNLFQDTQLYKNNDVSNKEYSKTIPNAIASDEIENTEERKRNKAKASRIKRLKEEPSIPQFPKQFTQNLIQKFAGMKLSPNCIDFLSNDCHIFFALTMDTLQSYAEHAGRKYINGSDTELLMYILRYASDRHSMDALLEQYVPIEIRQLTQAIAQVQSNPDDIYEL